MLRKAINVMPKDHKEVTTFPRVSGTCTLVCPVEIPWGRRHGFLLHLWKGFLVTTVKCITGGQFSTVLRPFIPALLLVPSLFYMNSAQIESSLATAVCSVNESQHTWLKCCSGCTQNRSKEYRKTAIVHCVLSCPVITWIMEKHTRAKHASIYSVCFFARWPERVVPRILLQVVLYA